MKYQIVYDLYEKNDLIHIIEDSWEDLQEYLSSIKKDGAKNITIQLFGVDIKSKDR